MRENVGKNVRLYIIGVVVIFFILTAGTLFYVYRNQVKTETITPVDDLISLEEQLEEPVILKLNNSYLLADADLCFGSFLTDNLLSLHATADSVNQLYSSLKDMIKSENVAKSEELIIPANAAHSGTPQEYEDSISAGGMKSTFHIYAWCKNMELNSGKKSTETHIVCIANDQYFHFEYSGANIADILSQNINIQATYGNVSM